jgi:flagellar biosynthesis protein FlhG
VSLADFASGRETDLEKLLIDTPFPHLRVIAATRAHLGVPQLRAFRRGELARAFRRLVCDVVLVDLGAGAHPTVVDYFLVSDQGILVLTPEPTSVENAYAFLRAAFYRRMRLAMMSHAVRERIHEAMDQRNERGIRTPQDLLREVGELDPEEGRRFVTTMQGFRPRIIVNGVRSAEDIRLGFSVKSVCKKYFGIEIEYLGYVNHDEAVRRAVRARQPLVVSEPGSDAAVYLTRIARKLAPPRRGPRPLAAIPARFAPR